MVKLSNDYFQKVAESYYVFKYNKNNGKGNCFNDLNLDEANNKFHEELAKNEHTYLAIGMNYNNGDAVDLIFDRVQ